MPVAGAKIYNLGSYREGTMVTLMGRIEIRGGGDENVID
jgi:hypothetical protein